jgi:hypothetical protein
MSSCLYKRFLVLDPHVRAGVSESARYQAWERRVTANNLSIVDRSRDGDTASAPPQYTIINTGNADNRAWASCNFALSINRTGCYL